MPKVTAIMLSAAVDIFSREANVLLRPGLLAVDREAFPKVTMPRRFNGFVTAL